MKNSYNNENAVVLTSGGMDSTVCLYWAVKNFKTIHALSFNYGQKHDNEIKAAVSICKKLNIRHKTLDISFMKDIVESNLFKNKGDLNQKHSLNKNVPSSFVPYRNMIFLNLAAAWASSLKANNIVIGVCETDYSGYADCRDDFIKSMQVTLNLATDFNDLKITIHTPLMHLTKAEEFKFAKDLNCLDIILNETVTCYNASDKINDYGKGCGECPSCILRKKGYEQYMRHYK